MTAGACGVPNQFLTLPNYVQVGPSRGDGRTYISHPDEDLRFDQTFPLATLIAPAQTRAVIPVEGSAELDRIWGMAPRFSAEVGVIGYTLQSAGLSLILQPSPLTLVLALALGRWSGCCARSPAATTPCSSCCRRLCAFTVLLAAFAAVDDLPSWCGDHPRCGRIVDAADGFGIESAGVRVDANRPVGVRILIAAQVAGIAESNLAVTQVNRLGAWAPRSGRTPLRRYRSSCPASGYSCPVHWA